MERPEVFLVRGTRKDSPEELEVKTKALYGRIRPDDELKDTQVVLKNHVGEIGQKSAKGTEITTYTRPALAKSLIGCLRNDGASSIVATDSTPTYVFGLRTTPQGHREVARRHGFTKAKIGVDFVVTDESEDGTANNYTEIESELLAQHTNNKVTHIRIPNLLYKKATQGAYILFLTHFTGHEGYVLGGAIKNMGMGAAAPQSKADVHHFKAVIDDKLCQGCGTCIDVCTHDAISYRGQGDEKAYVDPDTCQGCLQCLESCDYGALGINMGDLGDIKKPRVIEKAGEYVTKSLVIAAKEASNVFEDGHLLFVTDLTAITAFCDCDVKMLKHIKEKHLAIFLLRQDIGYLASTDPVALDQACINLVRQQVSEKEWHKKCGVFKFYFPNALTLQTQIAEELGMGSRQYKLTEINL